LDKGTLDSLYNVSVFVKTIERRQGLKMACIEEVACCMGFINVVQVEKLAKPLLKSEYGKYLIDMLNYDVRWALMTADNL
jgi:glucose-1-phosphate thymidylyltransferase